ncbi:MAG: 1-acyl-sn-glycerol-3-phosphate acyltransferase [Oscillospiraceae bacterium]|jgi:1-acyl-sn-glycerol-3-phosphate acyltransferase|nr:1-acyl-sn-glycerol-3-phosphate acyltransferase [Oscillospiraceae bacterium]
MKHKFIFGLLKYPALLFVKLRLGFRRGKRRPPSGACIVLANHTTDFDPILVGTTFGRHLYFVASEHVFRRKLLSRLLRWGFAPIARVKGSTDASSALAVLRAIKQGSSVGVFAEGERSWDGRTCEIHPTTARLVRSSRVNLVTYRISGGYLTSPRWSTSLRRGKMRCELVGVYSPEEVAAMTDDELVAVISRDLSEDANARQAVEHVRYKGKNRAERLESALYVCPRCNSENTMHSSGNAFACSACGVLLTFDEYGEFHGTENFPFKTVREWDEWQSAELAERKYERGARIYSDDYATLVQVGADHSETVVALGTMRLYEDKITLGTYNVSLGAVSKLALYGAETIVFSSAGVNYEITWSQPTNARKYLTMFNILKRAAL